jgi:hypothetical protein
MLIFPPLSLGTALTGMTVNSVTLEASTDKTTWVPATAGSVTGHWTFAGLTGLSAGTSGKIYVRLTVNSELKTTNGLALASDGSNGYQTFNVAP